MAEAGQDKTLRDVAIGRDRHGAPPCGRRCPQAPHHGHGITKGVEVFVRKVAPLGDPIEVTVRGYELSLRKSEAESVLVL